MGIALRRKDCRMPEGSPVSIQKNHSLHISPPILNSSGFICKRLVDSDSVWYRVYSPAPSTLFSNRKANTENKTAKTTPPTIRNGLPEGYSFLYSPNKSCTERHTACGYPLQKHGRTAAKAAFCFMRCRFCVQSMGFEAFVQAKALFESETTVFLRWV